MSLSVGVILICRLYLAGVRLQTGRPARIVGQVRSQAGFEL